MKSRFRYGAGCRCGGPETPIVIPPTPCDNCEPCFTCPDIYPEQVEVEVSGVVQGIIPGNCNCEGLANGTFTCNKIQECRFEYVDQLTFGDCGLCDRSIQVEFYNLNGSQRYNVIYEIVPTAGGSFSRWTGFVDLPAAVNCADQYTIPNQSFDTWQCDFSNAVVKAKAIGRPIAQYRNVPSQLQVELPGLLDSNCANCETDLAGTFVLEQQWPPDNSITFVSSEGCYYETTIEVDHTNPGETDPDCDLTTWVLGVGNIDQFPNIDGAGWFIELVSKRTGMVVQWAQQQPNSLPMDCLAIRTCPYYAGFGQRECRNVPVGYPSDVPVTLTPIPYVP